VEKPGITKILIWHQGALGDLLLAGPALTAISRYYDPAHITALGHPERWGLLARSLPVEEIWDSGEARWSRLYGKGPLPSELRERLGRFHLALIFSPRLPDILIERLHQAGILAVNWVPSFAEAGHEAVADLQANHLSGLGLSYAPAPFKLEIKGAQGEAAATLPGDGSWLAVGPGSGQPRKNWPLSHYYEVSRALSWEFRMGVVWLAGPAEGMMLPYLEALAAAQGQVLVAQQPLHRVAQLLLRCRLYLGNDSGLTHLAAAVGGPEVLALFGPTDPRVWAPVGPKVHVLTTPCPQAPCAKGRTITCSENQCMQALSPDAVLATAANCLRGQRPQVSKEKA
jgi:heptosyltransferase III